MARQNFERALDLTLIYEGEYVNHPRDPGGPTNMGITQATLSAFRGDKVTAADVKALTLEEARKIYKAQYWDRVRADNLPTGVDFAVFDYAVNSGPARAIKALQKAVGVKDDGVIGAFTLTAVHEWEPAYIVDRITAERMSFLRRLRTWSTFGKGWTRRVEHVQRAAKAMLARTPVEKVAFSDAVGKARDEDTSPLATTRGKATVGLGLAGVGEGLSQASMTLEPLQDIMPWVRVAVAVLAVAAVGALVYDLLRSKQDGKLADAA